jgi:hypothetical protein
MMCPRPAQRAAFFWIQTPSQSLGLNGPSPKPRIRQGFLPILTLAARERIETQVRQMGEPT